MPPLETARLELRQLEEGDRELVCLLLGDAGFMEFSEAGPLALREAGLRFDELLAWGRKLPLGRRLVVEKATGQVIGYAGLGYLDYDGVRHLELGYRLVADRRGQGFAMEAARAIVDVARRTGPPLLLGVVHCDNGASRRILDRLGFEHIDRRFLPEGLSDILRLQL